MRLPRPPAKRARVEIIPMIDAIFFLLVFFMISTLSMARVKGISLAVPRPIADAASRPPAAADTVILTLTARGDYLLNGTPTAQQAVPAWLKSFLPRHPDAVVVLDIDHSRSTQEMIAIFDQLGHVTRPAGDPIPILLSTGHPATPTKE